MHDEPDQISLGVGDNVALAPLDPFACIIAPRTTAFRGFHRLAVNHSGRWARLSACCLARRHDQGVVQRAKYSATRPRVEIALNRRVGREVLGQLPPLAPGGRNVEDRVHYRSHRRCTGPPERRRQWQKWFDHKPLRIRRIAFIAHAIATILSPSDFGPDHRALPRIFAYPRESQLAEITQLLFRSDTQKSVRARIWMSPKVAE